MLIACAPSSGTVGDDTSVWDRGMNAVRKANSVEPIADEVMGHFLSNATKKSRPSRWKQLRDTAAATTPAGDARRRGGGHELRFYGPAPVGSGPHIGAPRGPGPTRHRTSHAPARPIDTRRPPPRGPTP